MASLYIKSHRTNALAERLAEERGLTKTAAVDLALSNELAGRQEKRSVQEICAELRATSPLTFDSSIVIDKAFYDDLNDEGDD